MKRSTLLIVAGAGVAAWLLRPRASVTTAETFGLSTSYAPAVDNFARAIARAEGFYVNGAVPQRAKNPGNLKVPNWSPTINGISVFDSVDQGWAALRNQLQLIIDGRSQYYDLGMTIREMGRVWTTTEQAAWSLNVASALGVSVDTPLWQVIV